LLRALHFFDENDRVDEMAKALKEMDSSAQSGGKLNAFSRFMDLVNQSGDSSWQLLQNVYTTQDVKSQGISIALALSKNFFRRQKLAGACRVHGGGFAGTIQAYVPIDALPSYSELLEAVFGKNSVTKLRIRPLGAVELNF
ncbi:MAG: galactokinase, partial [Treponema sp.]|nr:galactokinase [Treponema sp.]